MSEFGKGYAYCLGLFLCHDERRREYKNRKGDYDDYPSMWFNGAADHLYELTIPDNLLNKERVKEFQDKCLAWRLNNCTWDDTEWAINEAKALLLEWDHQCGIECEKGDWE